MVKFLVIRFSSIGDIVLTTPVVRALKQQVEGAEVHFLTKKKFAGVLNANPYIDKLHALSNDYQQTIKNLKAENFDYVIDLHRSLRSFRVKNALKRISFTFDKLNFKKWLLVNLKVNRLPNVHIVDRYFKAVLAFSAKNDQKGLDFFADNATNIAKPQEYGVVVLGANHFTKQIPEAHVITIINNIKTNVVLVGGPSEKDLGKRLTDSTEKKLINTAGKNGIAASAHIIKHAKWVLTPDTGMMHIASAYKKNIVSVWGNTVPQFGMYPYLPGNKSKIFQVEGLNCRPCSKIGYGKCPKKHFNCMMKQNLPEIVKYINSL